MAVLASVREREPRRIAKPGRRAVVSFALLTLLGYESYVLAGWLKPSPEEQHPAWATWLADRGGELRSPPVIGSDTHPATEDAPGRYVRS